ncbi:Cyanobacterial aminoacyl-tRNA synthetase, CAAD domain containing protein [Parasponia andersonii]|uniref:Cyanobacterial aminoacyl-tRNA synthetase, CAAD domain containing protein n=1 Tax=Parasponia andersonii TaxID=3476 RepID=A0A2P5AQI5_PARAD|nr:Cyanobacterial aminoacyl-tRNA synthetase, CAAD domain containing protein [Parasponia andersonii]
MELCTAQAMSKLPSHRHQGLLFQNPNHLLHSKPSILPLCRARLSPFGRGLHSRLLYISKSFPKETSEGTSGETPSGTNQYFGEKRDGAVTLEDVPPLEKKVDNDSLTTEVPDEESSAEGPTPIFEFLDKFNIESEDTYSILLFGGGALLALWLASAVVGAIDSIPVFPKLLEIVGLGYTFWFTSRYLVFKKSREELVAKIEELKQEVLGSTDD